MLSAALHSYAASFVRRCFGVRAATEAPLLDAPLLDAEPPTTARGGESEQPLLGAELPAAGAGAESFAAQSFVPDDIFVPDDTPYEVAIPQDLRGLVHAEMSAACKSILDSAGYKGSPLVMENIVELRRDFNHMLHRLAEAMDSAGRSSIEEFMRKFLQEMKDGVTAAGSAKASMDIFDQLRSTLARELIRLNIDAMEPCACGRRLQLVALRSIPDFDIVDEGEFLGRGMFAVRSGWWRQGTSNSSLASASAAIPVAVKTYKVPDEDGRFYLVPDDSDEDEDPVRRLLDGAEQNAQRQLACVHNNVLRIFGSCRLDGSLRLVMPLITAGSLEANLRSLESWGLHTTLQRNDQHTVIGEMLAGSDDGRRSLALADLFAGISAALAHIHGFQPPVLHLDLKPANVLVVLMPGGMLQPKLCDFDAARVIAEETSTSFTTSSSKGIAEGTYRYMSPERLNSLRNSDAPAADIYSFAMVMAKCITAELVLPHDKACGHMKVLEKQRRSSLDLNISWLIRIYAGERPELPIGTRDLDTYERSIKECWHDNPAERPSSRVVAAAHLKRLKELRKLDGVSCDSAPSRSVGSAGSASDSCPTHPSSPSQQSFTESGGERPQLPIHTSIRVCWDGDATQQLASAVVAEDRGTQPVQFPAQGVPTSLPPPFPVPKRRRHVVPSAIIQPPSAQRPTARIQHPLRGSVQPPSEPPSEPPLNVQASVRSPHVVRSALTRQPTGEPQETIATPPSAQLHVAQSASIHSPRADEPHEPTGTPPPLSLQDCNAVDEPVVTADAARADSTRSCVDVLIASLCLWETISSPCKARMWIPLATSLQVKAMDPQHHFSITSLPAEALEKGMVVESIVHCTPEGCVDFLDPVLLQLPLPHLNTSKGLQVVTREHGAKGWRLYLEEADVQIHDGLVCFTAQHFCDFGIQAGKLHENEENWFTFTPHIQYCPSDGLCDVKCLVLARDCGKCQYIANQMREDSSCLRGWQQAKDGKTLRLADGLQVKVSSVLAGQTDEEAESVLDVNEGPKLMSLLEVSLGSRIQLRISNSSNKVVQSELLLKMLRRPVADDINGVVACGAGSALRFQPQSQCPDQETLVEGLEEVLKGLSKGLAKDQSTLTMKQNADEVDGSCVSRLQEGGRVSRVDLFCDGELDCLDSLQRELREQNPRFFVLHGHGMRSDADGPFGISAQNHQLRSACRERQLHVTFQRLAAVIQQHVKSTESRLKFVVVRSCYGYPLAKMVSQNGIDAVAWIDSPRVDHANEFTIDIVRFFQKQGGQDAQKAFKEACEKQRWSIRGSAEELDAARSVNFFAADPEVVVWELCHEGTNSAEFETWTGWARDKGNVMVLKGSMHDLLQSCKLKQTRCILITGSVRQEELRSVKEDRDRLLGVLPEVCLVIFAGGCASFAKEAQRLLWENARNTLAKVLPDRDDIAVVEGASNLRDEMMRKSLRALVDREEDLGHEDVEDDEDDGLEFVANSAAGEESALEELWKVIYGPDCGQDGVKTLMDRLLEPHQGGTGGAEESYSANRRKLKAYEQYWRGEHTARIEQ